MMFCACHMNHRGFLRAKRKTQNAKRKTVDATAGMIVSTQGPMKYEIPIALPFVSSELSHASVPGA